MMHGQTNSRLQDRILTYSCCTKKCAFTKVGSQITASCNNFLQCIIIYLTFKRAYAYATLAIRHVAWHMFKPISFKEFKKSGFTIASWYKLKGNCTLFRNYNVKTDLSCTYVKTFLSNSIIYTPHR